MASPVTSRSNPLPRTPLGSITRSEPAPRIEGAALGAACGAPVFGAAAGAAPAGGFPAATGAAGAGDFTGSRAEDAFHAVQGICSHEYFELDRGFLTDGSLTCALHLSRFDLDSGEALDPPADEPLAVYPVTAEGGRLILEFPG